MNYEKVKENDTGKSKKEEKMKKSFKMEEDMTKNVANKCRRREIKQVTTGVCEINETASFSLRIKW